MKDDGSIKLIIPMGGTGTNRPLDIGKEGEDENSKIQIVILPEKKRRDDSF